MFYVDCYENKQVIFDMLYGYGLIGDNVGCDVNYMGMNCELNNGMQVYMVGGLSVLLSL